jgi:hypothetical protein
MVMQTTITTPSGEAPRKIKSVAKLEPLLVNYTDGEGKDHTRVVFWYPEKKYAVILNEQIQGQRVGLPAQKWFAKELDAALIDDPEGAEPA